MKNLLLLFCAFALTVAQAEEPNLQTTETTSLCGPIPAVCYPATLSGGLGIGIYLVSFNQINNASSIPPMLEDFTCTDSTWLVPGLTYNLQVTTGQIYEESLTAWIDFNNDGTYDASEIIYHDSAVVYTHAGMITIPSNVSNTYIPLRMRVGSDYSGGTPLNGCNDAFYGQYEDYTIYFGNGNGVIEKLKSEVMLMSPNPFLTTATIVLNSSCKNAEMIIYDSMGTLVKQVLINNQNSILSRDGLPAGFYFYKVINERSVVIATGNFIAE